MFQTDFRLEFFSSLLVPKLEGALLLLLLVLELAGFLIAWRREGVGGTLMVVGALALVIFVYSTAGRIQLAVALIYSLPFLVPGLLFLVCWRRAKAFQG